MQFLTAHEQQIQSLRMEREWDLHYESWVIADGEPHRSAGEIFEHPQPFDAIGWRQANLLIKALLSFPDEAALVAADNVATDGHPPATIASGDKSLAIAHFNGCHLR